MLLGTIGLLKPEDVLSMGESKSRGSFASYSNPMHHPPSNVRFTRTAFDATKHRGPIIWCFLDIVSAAFSVERAERESATSLQPRMFMFQILKYHPLARDTPTMTFSLLSCCCRAFPFALRVLSPPAIQGLVDKLQHCRRSILCSASISGRRPPTFLRVRSLGC